MVNWFDGWHWLNQNAWVASALMSIALFGGAFSMVFHIHKTNGRNANYLTVFGLILLAVSFILTGVSVGEAPIIEGRRLIPFIRIMWLISAIIFIVSLAFYWGKRISIVREKQ